MIDAKTASARETLYEALVRSVVYQQLTGKAAATIPTRREALKMTDVEIIERLTSIRGVGPWTVEMALIFTLGRPDIFPATDYGVRKGFARVFGKGAEELPTPKELLLYSERWKPHRTTVAWCLWRALELK